MSRDTSDRALVELPPLKRRWPTGVTTLIGLAAGALTGLWIGVAPLGIAAGAALGIGIDSLANRLLNEDTGV